jgi:hypothetical protein
VADAAARRLFACFAPTIHPLLGVDGLSNDSAINHRAPRSKLAAAVSFVGSTSSATN